jgi:hypothetical protein
MSRRSSASCLDAHNAIGIAGHQIRVDLFHVLSHKAELRDTLGIKLMLVAETVTPLMPGPALVYASVARGD